MSIDPFVVGVAMFVAGIVLGLAVARRDQKSPDAEWVKCFMRDLKEGRYKRR